MPAHYIGETRHAHSASLFRPEQNVATPTSDTINWANRSSSACLPHGPGSGHANSHAGIIMGMYDSAMSAHYIGEARHAHSASPVRHGQTVAKPRSRPLGSTDKAMPAYHKGQATGMPTRQPHGHETEQNTTRQSNACLPQGSGLRHANSPATRA